MALDQEEFKRRREERAKLRQQQEAQRKKTLMGLAVAAAVLLLCGLLIFFVTRNAPAENPTRPPEITAAPTVPTTQPPPETTAPPTTVIHIAAAGDLNVTDKTVGITQNISTEGGISSVMTLQNFTSVFMDVVPVLSDADLTVLNFEGNLCGTPYGSQSASAPQSMMDALRSAGVDMVQMANSRCVANGISGLAATLQNLRLAGLEPLGAYPTESDFRKSGGYTIRNVRGVKVAFVAFTKGMDGMALPTGSEQCVNLLYTDYATNYKNVNTDGINKILRSVASEKPDVTVALVHWGSEFNDNTSSTQETIKKLLIEGGVDAIIGTHPHYVQKMEFDEAAGTFVAYSLGDFYSEAERAGTEYSVVLDLEITKYTETGETKITGYSYTPVFTVREEDGRLRVMRIQAAIDAFEKNHVSRVSEETYHDMVYALGRIEDRIHPKEEEKEESSSK